MFTLKRPLFVIVLVFAFVASSSGCISNPATERLPETPIPTVNSNGETFSYVINGKDKLPKLKRLYGEETILTLVAYDLAGKECLRIEDVYRKTTNLNELLGAGEYKLLFYDETGALLMPSQDVGEIVVLKDGVKADVISPSNPQPMGSFTSTKITYATVDSIELQFNLIKPAEGENFPVIVWIHGGGFGPGGLNAAEGFEDDFTAEGYAIAAVAYRSMLESYFPAQVEDVKGAIRYLRANASDLNVDPDRIFVLGTSSGGLIASLVGVTTDFPEYEGSTGGNLDVSSDVAGVINLFGSVTRAQLDDLSPDILPLTYEIFGCTAYGECPARYQLAIDNYITTSDPPFLILHGTEDQTVPYAESVELAELLTATGIPTTFVTAEGFGHDKDGIIERYFEIILSFLGDEVN